MVSVTALPVLHVMCIMCVHLLVDGQGNVPSCKKSRSRLVGELCFNFNGVHVTWYQARDNCELDGMTLAYVSSLTQIREILQGYKISDQVWIGASDEKKEGEFIWVASNETATELEQLWGEGEPNNKTNVWGGENCGSLFRSFYANDAPCNSKFPYLCIEKSCPYNLEVLQIVNNSLTLSWKPGFNGGPPQTFSVTYQDLTTNISRVSGTVKVPRVNQTTPLAIEYSLSGLLTKTPYKIFINASINNGETACTPLILITETTACPYNLEVLQIFNNGLTLSWKPGFNGDPPQTFSVTYQDLTTNISRLADTVKVPRDNQTTSRVIEYSLSGLLTKTPYKIFINTSINYGETACTPLILVTKTTACPYNLEVLQIFNNSLTLSWKPGFNGDPPQTFSVTYQDLTTNISRLADTVKVSRDNQTTSRVIEYSLSSLLTKTPYKIFINTSINNGETACTPLILVTKTTGPPECPDNVTIDEVANDRVSISWAPGQEDELPQTFTILAHNVFVLKNIPIESFSVGRLSTNNYKRVMYTVGNLSESTDYTFSVEVENNFGMRKCKDNFVKVTTTSGLQPHSFPTWLIFLLIFTPLVLATGIVGFVCARRKSNRTSNMEIPNTYDSLTKEIHIIDCGDGTDLVYSAPIALSALTALTPTERDTTEHDYEPMNSEPTYANASQMKFSDQDDPDIYMNK